MQSFLIDQALYGYDDGHRLLATSRKLDTHSQYTALQLSDRSAPTVHLPPSGYLTGHPLSHEGLYVLSRTWAAPEMERPGCVWTHSLFVAFTDLAQILDLDQLAALFRRPKTSQDYAEYARPLEFELSLIPSNQYIDIQIARSIVTALYGQPEEQIFLSVTDQAATETVVMAVWGQQWPRLRRDFRFCTLTSMNRSTPDHQFDLQLTSPEFKGASLWAENHRSRTYRDIKPALWLDVCLQDLNSSQHPLRNFLRRVGGDLTRGRAHFAELCELYGHITSEKEMSAIERTLEYVEHKLAPGEGRLLRKSAIENAVRQAALLSDRSLVTLLPCLPTDFSSFPKDSAPKLARRYWRIDPDILLASTTPSEIRKAFGQIAQEITLADAWKSMGLNENLFRSILEVKPEVLALPQIWNTEEVDSLIERLRRVHAKSLKVRILNTIVSANRRDLAQIIAAAMGAEFVLESLIRRPGDISETGIYFVCEALAQGPNGVGTIGKYLRDDRHPLSKRLIHALTSRVKPSDTIEGQRNEIDPWAVAWTGSTGWLDADSTDAVHIFCAERAFFLGSSSGASLLSIAFDRLFDRLSRYEVSCANMVRLSHLFDSSDWWDWSYARQFMRAIANFAIAVELPEPELLTITRKTQRLIELLKMITHTKRGWRYLKELTRKSAGTSPLSKLLDKRRLA